jgi:toxin YoeB
MQIELTSDARKHLEFWRKTKNQTILNKIEKITDSILQHPYKGIGKPEPLKHELSGFWSRRINQEHRFVYCITENAIIIASLKGHYA